MGDGTRLTQIEANHPAVASSFLVAGVYSGDLKNAGLKWLNKKGSISRLQSQNRAKTAGA